MFKSQLENHPLRTSLVLAVVNLVLYYAQKSYAYDIASFSLNIPTLLFGISAVANGIAFVMFTMQWHENYLALLICEYSAYLSLASIALATYGYHYQYPLITPIIFLAAGIYLIVARPGNKKIWSIIGFIIAFFGLMKAF